MISIISGYYQQAIIHMMKIMPKKNKQITPSQAKEILNIYKEYLDILLPLFYNPFLLTHFEWWFFQHHHLLIILPIKTPIN